MKKKIILISLSIVFSEISLIAQSLPKFSTDGNENWYYIQFKRGSAVVQDMGEGSYLMTADAIKGRPTQLWKITGTQNSCEIISKNGRHIYYNNNSWSNNGRFVSSATESGNLKLIATTSTYAPAWELQSSAISGYSMNQWSGYGAGRELGAWTANDINNPFDFVSVNDMTSIDTVPKTRTEYKYVSSTTYAPSQAMTLWYTTPVTAQTCSNPWMDYALPIGNGQFGAMIYGGINQDIVQFNEKTLWTGSSTDRGAYQNFGNLYMEDLGNIFSTSSSTYAAKNYYRDLDLSTATATSSWTSPDGNTTYTRQYVASYPNQCVAIHIKASSSGSINTHFFLYNPHGNMARYSEAEGVFSGKLTTLSYNARIKVVPTGGEMTTDSTGIYVKNADEVMIILAGGTDYNPTATGYIKDTSTLDSTISKRVDDAADIGWDELYKRHINDYQPIFNRVSLNLDGADNKYPTNKLLTMYTTSNRSKMFSVLEELYFQYGRYLLIASSRGIDLPNNLQGIWNNSNDPAWQCDMHANINVQMNYWPAENTNLSDFHNNYLNYLYNMAIVQPQWQSYAKDRCGQTTGWANFTENNIFGHCTTWHNDYVEAGAWACSHLWQHYRYTLDKDFLKEKALPVMISCVKFWMERLVLASDGTYECPNEWSPEHGPSENATAHSQQIVWNLFSNTLDAIKEIGNHEAGITDDFVSKLTTIFKRLDNGLHKEVYKGTYGSPRFSVNLGDSMLREWKYTDYATGNGSESSHRHLSHLMALYPLDELPLSSPFFTAAVNSLRLRGIQSQGWSMGWKMNLWARALEGDSCAAIFKLALRHSNDYVVNMASTAGGVYYNLLDSHSPFKIDGNFGVCAGMAEMLLQSHTDTIQFIPALPKLWPTGSITGLRATNNFEVDENWENMKMVSAVVKSYSGMECLIRYDGIDTVSISDINGDRVAYKTIKNNAISFPTKINGIYNINFKTTINSILYIKKTGTSVVKNGNFVCISGEDILKVTAFRVDGEKILQTNDLSFKIPKNEKGIIIINLLKKNGKEENHKIIL